jgi:outer membrane receptor protein involved in Fe transport
VRELYGEVHVPLVKDLPGVKSLALNLGIRSAWYSGALGSTTDGKYAFEYKPYSDLLLRGSYNDVYRAPNVSELYGGAAQSAPGYTDPCAGLTTTQLAQHTAACKNVGAGFHQANPQGTAVNVGNPALSPEKGYATDFGAVFNPSFYKPLTLEVDYWRYSLKEFISGVSLNQILDACFADNGSSFCGTSPDGQPWFSRDNHGNITNAQQLLLNSDRLYTSGWDFAGKLNYNNIQAFGRSLGSVQFGADITYLDQWDYKYFNPATGAYQGDDSVAGQVETAGLGGGAGKFAPFPRFKGLMFVFWNYGDFTTTIEDRYIGSVKDTTSVNTYGVGYANYVDVSETYKVKRYNTDLTFGINDIGAQGIVPLYDGAHAGAPATIYDPRGRNFYGRLTIHFK